MYSTKARRARSSARFARYALGLRFLFNISLCFEIRKTEPRPYGYPILRTYCPCTLSETAPSTEQSVVPWNPFLRDGNEPATHVMVSRAQTSNIQNGKSLDEVLKNKKTTAPFCPLIRAY
jgi:hypothetical protein